MHKNSPQQKEQRIMTVPEVAAYLRLSQAKVYRMAKAGTLPATQLGNSWRFRKDLIDQWFQERVEGQVQKKAQP